MNEIRRYQAGEEQELRTLFFNTIRTINVRDYSIEHVQAWAPEEYDREKWRQGIEQMNPFVCVSDGEIVGYASLLETGCVEHFYVHQNWQRKGIGDGLMERIEAEASTLGLSELYSNVSITAKPFFESRGFRVVRRQQVPLGSVVLVNYRMNKQRVGKECDEAAGSQA